MHTRRSIAEAIREHDPSIAEAIELGLFTDQEIAEDIRVTASVSPRFSNKFYNLLALARAMEEL